MNNNRLNESKIGTANVIVDIVPKGKCIPNVKMTPTSITIHQRSYWEYRSTSKK